MITIRHYKDLQKQKIQKKSIPQSHDNESQSLYVYQAR